MPFGAGNQCVRSPWVGHALGAHPNARENARENPSAESYPAENAVSVTELPRRNSQAARSNNTRRRIATGDSPAALRT
ncbi:hypothetical protein GCM10009813_07920 [Brevibacterium marinum]|uniref:Uncharacterized protein n=1 Tax=Brevibacterium marinum TaxID=418643 RepID=A0A846RUQ4_9MICO|nr:hypothetical protein [Brevibacterium marinum]